MGGVGHAAGGLLICVWVALVRDSSESSDFTSVGRRPPVQPRVSETMNEPICSSERTRVVAGHLLPVNGRHTRYMLFHTDSRHYRRPAGQHYDSDLFTDAQFCDHPLIPVVAPEISTFVESHENHQICCHQMSDFKAKMHQIQFRLGLRPRPRWGSLQRSPRPPSWI